MTDQTAQTVDEAAIREAIRRGRLARELEQRRRVLNLLPPPTAPTVAELNRLAKAERKMAQPDKREEGVTDRLNALHAYQARLVSEDDTRRRKELTALITAPERGGCIVSDKAVEVRGRLRILSQDGLVLLHEPPKGDPLITDRQYHAGLLFRAAYEGAMPPSKIANYAGARGGNDTGEAEARRQSHHIRWNACICLCKSQLQRTALERIAGDGQTTRTLATGGKQHARIVQELKRVLDRIATRYM